MNSIHLTQYFRLLAMVSVSLWVTISSGRAQVYEKLASLTDASGRSPNGGLVTGPDENYYGTTYRGGSSDYGTVFRLTPSGVITTLVNFNGANGQYPTNGLTRGTNGFFYGTTSAGGNSNSGTIFKMTPLGDITTLVNFGAVGQLIQASDGNFYGTVMGSGSIFRMTPSGTTTIFATGGLNGTTPIGRLLEAQDGNLYGVTKEGGSSNMGTLFKVSKAGVLTTVLAFTGNNGSSPVEGLTQDQSGSIYGMTTSGGNGGYGTLFKLTPGDNFSIISHLMFGESGSLLLAGDGNFYGASTTVGPGIGSIYRMTPLGVRTSLARFGDPGFGLSIGSGEVGKLVQGIDGNFYGVTSSGGNVGLGTAFKISPSGSLTTLVHFQGNPGNLAAIVQGGDGAIYGGTETGGTGGRGVIFRATPTGSISTLANLSGTNGANIYAAMIQGNDGNFYGTTAGGGVSNKGIFFRMTPAGTLTTLVNFNGTNGHGSLGPIVQNLDGNFYGTSPLGGSNNIGVVFKVTPSGVLTIPVSFTGVNGSSPFAGLVAGADGTLYGTTHLGGSLNFGTVFKITPNGLFSTIVHFVGSNGKYPNGLVFGLDGNLYGMTKEGGSGNNNGGTVFKVGLDGTMTTIVNLSQSPIGELVLGSSGDFFGIVGNAVVKITPGGVLTTVINFADTGDSGILRAGLILGADGNLYGPRGNSIYRLIFPGLPIVSTEGSLTVGLTSASLVGKVNPRGVISTVEIEYGTDGLTFPNSTVAGPSPLLDYTTSSIGAFVTGLEQGRTYYYRIRASNSFGQTQSAVASFSTLATPLASVGFASELSPSSARLNAVVNARSNSTSVVFQWGTDSNTFPNSMVATPGTVTGNSDVSVNAAVAGLTKGTRYYYRISATNAGGTTVSGTQSFITLTEPTATLSGPSSVTSHSVVLNGSVNANGANSSVIFEYGTDGITFPFSVGATPATVAGETNSTVSASLSNLTQGATYYYRVKATSAGGIGFSGVGSFSLNILSGFTRVFPSAPPNAQGSVLVTLTPPGVGGWRFVGEQLWRSPGVTVGALTTGDRGIEFRPVPGYIQPTPETVSVVSGGPVVLVDRDYYETSASGGGGLSVTLKPASLAATSVPQAVRAQWRLLGDDDTQWRDSDTSLTGLFPGTYLVECKPVAGRTTPPISSVLVQDFQTAFPTLTYFLTDSLTGAPPTPVPFASVTTDGTENAFAYVGQIRSNLGSSTGFVVKPRVVATAGHVVFDDGKLSGVTGLQWLFQRQSGIYEPKPQEPRGFYLFTGYSAARREPGVIPGEGTTLSKNLDVAALYFVANATANDPNFPGRLAPTPPGGGAYGGFLASDATVNEFLLSSAQKILVGYPVDGISPSDQGLMHATAPLVGTPPQAVSFTQTFDRTYTTPDIRGSGGMSGGPLCVKYLNGNYYPAAIYLGGTGQTIVRSIDSAVIDMFNRAETSGNDDSNNTGGGITLTSVSSIGRNADPGAIKVTILPAAAANAARWGLKPESSNRSSGSTYSGRTAGEYILRFTTISGFQAPTTQNVRINGGQLKEITFTYVAPPPTISSSSSASGSRGQPLTYQIVANQSPTSYSLSGTLPVGLSFNPNNGQLTGILQQAGVFIVTLGATNAGGTGNKTLVLTSRPSVFNQSASTPLGQPTSQQIASSESGTDLNYTANDLPPGTSLDEQTGLITGTPTQAGVFNSLFTVTKDGASASAILTLTVTATALDIWRLANFQTTTNTGTAADNADPDGDGQTNRYEFAAATNPNNSTDVFKILTTTKNASTFTVTAAGKAGRAYILERRSDLSTGPWTTVASIGPLATDGPIVLSDNNANSSKAFYRLRVSAP